MRFIFIPLLLSVPIFCFANNAIHQHSKPVISDAATFIVNDDFNMVARIDSGATRSSVNAHNITVKDADSKMKNNIGKAISFIIIDAKGDKHLIQSTVLDVKTIKTPQGRDHRYLVNMFFSWNGQQSKIAVNLRDRTKLEFKLLIGRDWLNKNAVVDVAPKSIIGGVEQFILAEDFKVKARVDTGAASTSINATDISVQNSAVKMTNNVGKLVSFTMVNQQGNTKRITAPIVQVVEINNAIGMEYRYKVAMKIQWNQRIQTLNVNLKDRTKLTYKMLIGRDWLSNNAIVDTSL